VVLAVFLWRFNSRAAATPLVLVTAAAVVTVAHLLGVKMPGGADVLLAAMALWAAIRSMGATFKLRGRC
jgi:hypothetical protein